MRLLSLMSIILLPISTVLGGVVVRRSDVDDKLSKLDQTWAKFSEDDFCNKFDPQKRSDDAEELWKEFNIGKWFDGWLDETEDLKDWTKDMDKEYHRNGQSNYNCKGINDTCLPPTNCRVHYQHGIGPAYWILQGAARFHQMMRTFQMNMIRAQTKNTLKVDRMVEDLGLTRTNEGVNLLGILNGAFTIAAGATAPAAAISGPLSVIAGAIGIAGSVGGSPHVPDPSIKYEEQVYEGYETTITAMQKMLRDIFQPFVTGDRKPVPMPGLPPIRVPIPIHDEDHRLGGIGSSRPQRLVGGDNVNALPGLTGSAKHPLVRFFAEGKFLPDNWLSELWKIQKDYEAWHRAGLAARMLKDQDFVIVINTDIQDESKCKDDSGRDYWDEENGRCFRTMRQMDDVTCEEGPSLRKWDGGVVNKAIEDYDLSRKEFYRNSYDCAKSHNGGEVATYNQPGEGIPTCFFNMPVVEATFDSWGGPGLRLKGEPSINTLPTGKGCSFSYSCYGPASNCRIRGPKWEDFPKRNKMEVEHL